jgi:hypothetical protein
VNWRKNNTSYMKTLNKKKRMDKWVSKNGPPTKDDDQKLKEEWLSKNEITICPPFGYKGEDNA